MLYHVTSRENGLEIWDSKEIKVDSEINQNRKKRSELRSRVDEKANAEYSAWVNRQNAIFAWSTFDKAVQYASYFREPAIVEFDYSGTAWCVENYVVEDVFEMGEITDDSVNQIVEWSRKWENKQNNELEIWLKPSSVTEIYRVTDSFGEPLERH